MSFQLEKVNKVLDYLSQTKISPFVELVDRTREGITNGQVLLKVVNRLCPAVTNIELSDEGGTIKPAITIGSLGVQMGAKVERDAADMARTLAVLGQYPTLGFQRRMVAVYREAIGLQKQFLEATALEDVNLDPRKQSVEEIIKGLLAKAAFDYDLGFCDFKIKALEMSSCGKAYEDLAAKLESDPNKCVPSFVVERYYLMKIGAKRYESTISKLTADDRALNSAEFLIRRQIIGNSSKFDNI